MMQVVNPPHSLEELLAVMAVKDEINVGALEQAITSSPWADKFRAYLRKMKLEDDENILKFLILVQVISHDIVQYFGSSLMSKFYFFSLTASQAVCKNQQQ